MDQTKTNIDSLIAEDNAGAISFGAFSIGLVDETRS
jgi:hypothetical protein